MDNLDLTPEELELLMSLGIAPEELDQIGKQQEIADALRYMSAPEGTQAGRVYVAANPLEHIGRVAQMYQGKKMSEDLKGQREEVYDRMSRGRGKYWDIIQGNNTMAPMDRGLPEVTVPDPGELDLSGLPQYDFGGGMPSPDVGGATPPPEAPGAVPAPAAPTAGRATPPPRAPMSARQAEPWVPGEVPMEGGGWDGMRARLMALANRLRGRGSY